MNLGPPNGADKALLRRQFRSRRRASLEAALPGLRQMALRQLPALLDPPLRLGLYWPLGSEPDLDPFAAGGLAERLGQRLLRLLSGMASQPDSRLGALDILEGPERATILRTWNDTAHELGGHELSGRELGADASTPSTLPALFAAQALRTPDADNAPPSAHDTPETVNHSMGFVIPRPTCSTGGGCCPRPWQSWHERKQL